MLNRISDAENLGDQTWKNLVEGEKAMNQPIRNVDMGSADC